MKLKSIGRFKRTVSKGILLSCVASVPSACQSPQKANAAEGLPRFPVSQLCLCFHGLPASSQSWAALCVFLSFREQSLDALRVFQAPFPRECPTGQQHMDCSKWKGKASSCYKYDYRALGSLKQTLLFKTTSDGPVRWLREERHLFSSLIF